MSAGTECAVLEPPRQTTATIYLVDDDASLLRALARRLRAEDFAVETFQTAEAFLAHHRAEADACAVLDLQMPGRGGLEIQRALAAADEPLPVVFLTAHGDVSSSVRAMKDGAIDFLTKPVRGEDLLEAVERALIRGAAMRETGARQRAWRERYATLTPAERRVFTLIVNGLPNKGIVDEVGACLRTVKAHRAKVMQKMGVQAPAELGRVVEWLGDVFEKA